MSDATPTPKQSLRGIITDLFPWLAGVVAVTGAAGKGLAIRAAGGLLHLAGGPDDPAVVRVGDLGNGGAFVAVPAGLNYLGADNTTAWQITGTVSGAPVVFAIVPVTGSGGAIVTKNTDGSEKVTCA
jgi:hypothetical protein